MEGARKQKSTPKPGTRRRKRSKPSPGKGAADRTLGPRVGESFELVAGNGDRTLGAMLIHGAVKTIRSTSGSHDLSEELLIEVATGLMGGVAPKNGVEALLAAQMAETHMMAAELGSRALNAPNGVLIELYGRLADRLLRTFVRQVEALARLRGRTSSQVVRVEHVHVEAGGQAIVGAVEGRGQ